MFNTWNQIPELWNEEMALWLEALPALLKDQNLVPTIQVSSLTTAHDWSTKESNDLSWPLGTHERE